MDSSHASSIVMTSMVMSLLLQEASKTIWGPGPDFQGLYLYGFATVGLLLLAMFLPYLAAMLAVLVAVAEVIGGGAGTKAFKQFANLTGGTANG